MVKYANPQEHVPQAGRNNLYNKGIIHPFYHRLLFDQMPHKMVNYLGLESARRPNMLPAKHRVPKYYSPHIIICQENVDNVKHLKILLGTYVLDDNKTNPTYKNVPRRLDCIYLQATDRYQVGQELLHFQTNPVIPRNHVSPAPIIPTIINQLHTISDMYSIPSGIKIANRTGRILYDSAYIAGVDYSEDDDDENEFENESGNEEDNDKESSDVLTED